MTTNSRISTASYKKGWSKLSRSQQNQVFQQGQQQNAAQYQNAQTSYNQAQQGVTSYKDQLAKFAAGNPYVQGGQFQTAQNQQLADTAGAGAQAARQAAQAAAVRMGTNPNAGIASGEAVAEANDRNLASQEAKATQQRIQGQAGYNQQVLNATAVPEEMEAKLAEQQQQGAQGSAGTEEQAAQQPSFMDMLGQFPLQAGVAFAQGLGGAVGKGCWIAAELYGGWDAPRTVLVRQWLVDEISRRWYGPAILWAYGRWGPGIAVKIRTNMPLRKAMRRLFDLALGRAMKWNAPRLRNMLFAEEGGTGDGR